MRKEFLIVVVLVSLAVWLNPILISAQQSSNCERKPVFKEEGEAKTLAITFLKRYEETQDIAPLIKEFFIVDFAARLKVCYSTEKCEGFAKDFWKFEEGFFPRQAAKKDLVRYYTNIINAMFLHFQTLKHLNPKGSDDDAETAQKIILKEFRIMLRDDAKLIKFAHDYLGIDLEKGVVCEEGALSFSYKFKSLRQFRYFLSNMEKLISVFREIEHRFRASRQDKNLNANMVLSPDDFRVDVESNVGKFFNYPIGTRILEVWAFENMPFKIDLIREKGMLKIVAVYPPID